jgi:hypothetical protein
MSNEKNLAAILLLNREAANRFIRKSSNKHLIKVLKKAEKSLLDRIQNLNVGDHDTFTAIHLQTVLENLRHVMRPLIGDMREVILDTGNEIARTSAIDTLEYITAAEKKFRGIADISGLRLREAAIVDRVISGTESSQLRRLMSSGDPGAKLTNIHPGKNGILQRYGTNVVAKFEEILQQKLIAKTHWLDARTQIIEASPFLSGKVHGEATRWAERILRTESMYASNAANLQTMQEANEDFGDMVKILAASFDNRTAADSYAVHGQIRKLDEPFESWYGFYMHPPNRPNDREIVVPHRLSWPLPIELKWKSDSEVYSRWALEKRKKSPPPRPKMTTISLDKFAKEPSSKKIEK